MDTYFLYDTQDAAIAAKKKSAAKAPSVGAHFTTPANFVRNTWALFGDGRTIIQNIPRVAAVFSLLGKYGFNKDIGTANMLARFIRDYAPYIGGGEGGEGGGLQAVAPPKEPGECSVAQTVLAGKILKGQSHYPSKFSRCGTRFVSTPPAPSATRPGFGAKAGDSANKTQTGDEYFGRRPNYTSPSYPGSLAACPRGELSPSEHNALKLADEYFCVIRNSGFIEPSHAALKIAPYVAHFDINLDHVTNLTPAQQILFGPVPGAAPTFPNMDGILAECILCSGETAVLPALSERILDFFESAQNSPDKTSPKRAAIFCKHPSELFRQMSDYLAAAGIKCTCKDSMQFADTPAGRAFVAYLQLSRAQTAQDAVTYATDFLYSAFSGASVQAAARFNTDALADRTFTCQDIIEKLTEVNKVAATFRELFENAYNSQALGKLAQLAAMSNNNFDLNAILALESVLASCAAFDVPVDNAFELAVKASFATQVAQDDATCAPHRVDFLPISDAASVPPASYDAVFINDVTDATFSAKRPTRATDSLIDKLHLPPTTDTIARARASFAQIVAAGAHKLAFVWPLTDHAGNDIYTSFVFDEYIDSAYRGLAPKELAAVAAQATFPATSAETSPIVVQKFYENRFTQGIGATLNEITAHMRTPLAARGALNTDITRYLPQIKCGEGEGGIILSPSGIESYMGCPYKWFINNVIRVSDPGEDFGAKECGTFVHSVFERLMSRLSRPPFNARRTDEVAPDDLTQIFSEIFDETLFEQADLPPGRRFVPVNASERHELTKLKRTLRKNIDLQAMLPKAFGAAGQEVRLNPASSKTGLKYAGAHVRGIIDRIDTDPHTGDFYILDYKGSVTTYAAGTDAFTLQEGGGAFDLDALPSHVQALIYAQVLRRELAAAHNPGGEGEMCVGALYASYRARTQGRYLNGSVDGAHLPLLADRIDKHATVEGDFSIFLNKVEQALGTYIERLKRSDIAPNPRGDACKYCPYKLCERRKNGSK